MPKRIVKEMADYCWSNNFITVFRNFFVKHSELFEDAPEMSSGEHNLAYYTLFEEYLQVYEDTLMTKLDTLDCSIEEFYGEVDDAQHHTTDPYVLMFIDCLLASTNYDSFYKVMWKEGRKRVLNKPIVASPLPKISSHSAPVPNAALSSASEAKMEVPAAGAAGGSNADCKSPSRAMRIDDAKGYHTDAASPSAALSEEKRIEWKPRAPERDYK